MRTCQNIWSDGTPYGDLKIFKIFISKTGSNESPRTMATKDQSPQSLLLPKR